MEQLYLCVQKTDQHQHMNTNKVNIYSFYSILCYINDLRGGNHVRVDVCFKLQNNPLWLWSGYKDFKGGWSDEKGAYIQKLT